MAEVIDMPKMSDTMEVGTLVTWLKKEGDSVTSGDSLAEVETDKATMELENFAEGVVLKHYVAEGDQVAIGAPICAIGEKGEEAPDVGSADPAKKETKEEKTEPKEEKKAAEAPAPKEAEKTPEPEPEPAVAVSSNGSSEVQTETTDGKRIIASPLARRVAADKGVDLIAVAGSGPHGRIVRADVEAAVGKSSAATATATTAPAAPAFTAPPTEDQLLPVSNMRATIARRLVESKTTVPHFYLETEVAADALMKLRADLNAELAELPPEQGGIKFTVNDFILKATAVALRRVPLVNVSWEDKQIRQHGGVHLAFGVAVPEGLLTPVIRDAHAKPLRQISLEAKELIGKARNKKLKPDEMTGSTFTVTNLGMFGITSFYGIINPPNAGILSVGATVKQPVVSDSGEIIVQQRMKIGFSGDHRAVDGALGAEFMAALRGILETPATMLV